MSEASNNATTTTSVSTLAEVVRGVCPVRKTYADRQFGNMDEVYPNIFIGDISSATKISNLKNVGVTHVLNTAQGDSFGAVRTNAGNYEAAGIKYLSLDLNDLPSANIAKYFESSAVFIDDGLKEGGKILVHCFMGISRSATITCAFLMLKRGMTAVEALTQVRKNRLVSPNEGFLEQLVQLDNDITKKRSQP